MRDEVDFGSYAAARWHLVVRSLVLLGTPPGHAATLAREALAQRRSEWSHRDVFDDLDAELYRAVLDLRRHDRSAWWGEPPFDDELWTEIEPGLDRLTPVRREWLVLRHVAELPDAYIEAVVGEPEPAVARGAPTGDQLRDAARMVPGQPPDLEQVDAMAAALGRRRRRRGMAIAAGVVGVAGLVALGAALWASDDDPDSAPTRELDAITVTRETSASPVGWYADGRLHLPQVVLDLPDVRAVATINDGAVYTDDDGELVHVDDQGQRTVLATIGLEGTFVVSDEDGLVAWVDDEEDAELVVLDLASRTEAARVPIQGFGAVIAVDSGFVYFRDDTGDHELTLETGAVEYLGTANLLDVSLRVQAFQPREGELVVQRPMIDVSQVWPGDGAQLSEDGNFVLTWVDGALTLYDTRSGDEVPPDLGLHEAVLAAEFGPRNTISYLVMNRRQSNGIVSIRTCALGLVFLPSGEPAPKCTEEVAGQFRGVDTELMLAR